jgi:hypothetical protein
VLEVNDFNAVRIALASPDQIKQWSYGEVGADHIAQSRILARPVVVHVLRRYPVAPRGGGRVGGGLHHDYRRAA